jgi:NADPH2:quinone reductase
MVETPTHGLELRTTVGADGYLRLELVETPVRSPGPGEVVVRVEAAPINPSDLGLLVGPADLSRARLEGSAARPVLTAPLPEGALARLAARVDKPLPAGNEGAGLVVAAGEGAQEFVGRRVAALSGAMYAQYATVRAADCLPLPPGASSAEGASCFVNPLTALGMVETMRLEGHSGLVHTAAASNLGQMLVRICQADGVPLVNIVRRPEQAELLRGLGAAHVCDSSAPGFREQLVQALQATGATLAFDAIGGGRIAGQILSGMEAALVAGASGAPYSRYGSDRHKQVYVYGMLDAAPTEFAHDFGMAWGLGGWLLTPFLRRIGREGVERLRARVAAELKTTFASRYGAEVSLAELLTPQTLAAANRRATGDKLLVNPAK